MATRTMTVDDINTRQVGALNKIRRLLGHHSIPDGDRFHVSSIVDIGRGAVMVFGSVCKDPADVRWFEHHYTFTIGPRGAITMVDGPVHTKEGYQGRTWCGIHIRIR